MYIYNSSRRPLNNTHNNEWKCDKLTTRSLMRLFRSLTNIIGKYFLRSEWSLCTRKWYCISKTCCNTVIAIACAGPVMWHLVVWHYGNHLVVKFPGDVWHFSVQISWQPCCGLVWKDTDTWLTVTRNDGTLSLLTVRLHAGRTAGASACQSTAGWNNGWSWPVGGLTNWLRTIFQHRSTCIAL